MTPDPFEHFDRIVARASGEMSLPTTVADRVLDTLRQQSRVSPIRGREEPVYAVFGYGSVAVACAALILLVINTGDDSLMMLANPFIMELP